MIKLPASPAQALQAILAQTFSHLIPGKFDSPAARVLLLAIGLQESGFRRRRQAGGPAHGLWQFERGGVDGVLKHPASQSYAQAVCVLQDIPPTEGGVYDTLLTDDLLACAFARLLLWTDAAPLPALDQQDTAWAYYQRNWRPGRPHPESWPQYYQAGLQAVTASGTN